MRRRLNAAALSAAFLSGIAFGCGSGDTAANPDDNLAAASDDDSLGIGTDLASTDKCLSCHRSVDDDWQHPNTHRQLFDCATCHEVSDAAPGPGHAQKLACSKCHSQAKHSNQDCTVCHNQHGSANAYMIRTELPLPGGGKADIHFTSPDGASADGLVRAGVDGEVAGTGLCEVCHDGERTYYNRDGTGAPHETIWCASCHAHSAGFIADERSAAD